MIRVSAWSLRQPCHVLSLSSVLHFLRLGKRYVLGRRRVFCCAVRHVLIQTGRSAVKEGLGEGDWAVVAGGLALGVRVMRVMRVSSSGVQE